MKKTLFVGAVLLFSVAISLTFGAQRAAAQGPAGNGAAAAAQDNSHSLHALNPINWVKKDSKSAADASPASRSDAENKLTPNLQAALHASHNLGVDFNCLRADATGVHTSANISGCKVVDGEKPEGLTKAIRQLKPDANAKQATKEAEQQAKDDLKAIGG